jgi:drug/metabolite transporter (DMT)-like permease
MKEFWWRLPLLRRLSSFQRGFAVALATIFAGSLLIVFDRDVTAELSDQVLSDMAQIGATLLVAYSVEVSWLVKGSRSRGSNKEMFVGFIAGIGASGALGIAMAVSLLGHEDGVPFNGVEHWAASWAVVALSLLAGLVGMLPYAIYEWGHAINTEYPDD